VSIGGLNVKQSSDLLLCDKVDEVLIVEEILKDAEVDGIIAEEVEFDDVEEVVADGDAIEED